VTDSAIPRPVRTRFAPSPTGPLHIGGVRSALFAWLQARRHNGQFILRIEDTDQKRFQEGSLELITDALRWLGINWDEGPDIGGPYGPYVQSERLEFYQQWAQWLVDHDKAYRCYTTSEELKQLQEEQKAQGLLPGYDRRHRDLTPEQEAALQAEGRTHVIRLKMPLEGKTVVHDLVRGKVEFDNNTLQDVVILKSDGFPTYHLAHVVDDHLMKISHVTRANEWLPSLPLHIQLWQAFGWDIPEYAHLPVLLNPNGKGKLSKRSASFTHEGRHVPVLAKEFKEAGYLPGAVVNFLTNIGWNFGDEREVFDLDEAIQRFDLTQINPANSAYPIEKLDWLNGIYIREKTSPDELAQMLRKPLEQAGFSIDDELLHKVVPLVRVRLKSLNDVVEMAGFFFREEFIPPASDDLIQKKMDAENTRAMLEAAYHALMAVDDFSTETTHNTMLELTQELGLKNSQVFGALRVAVTGQRVSTPTFETMEVLGKQETLRRIQLAVDLLAHRVLTE
jgi:glutamyl-tRNA synthetase